jgi:8-oxo-dGTP pyrophosphatase MutT (NUDIX family)
MPGIDSDPEHFAEHVRAILASRQRKKWTGPGLVCASVLIPLQFRDGEWHVLVTQRSQTVEHHRGQISFPGGACEAGDAGLLDTALRETFEEIGVPPEAVEVLGALDDMPTITDFIVTPFVGILPYPFDYRLSSSEVEVVVQVPLSFLRDSANLRVEQREHKGRVFDVLFWDYGSERNGTYTIWGFTARLLKDFLDLIR